MVPRKEPHISNEYVIKKIKKFPDQLVGCLIAWDPHVAPYSSYVCEVAVASPVPQLGYDESLKV